MAVNSPHRMDLVLSSDYKPSQGTVLPNALPKLATTQVLNIALQLRGFKSRGPPRSQDNLQVQDFLSFFNPKPAAPILHTFGLEATRSTPDTVIPENSLFTDTPQLQEVRLVNWNFNWGIPLPATFNNITSLSIILDPITQTANNVPRSTAKQIVFALHPLKDLRFLELERVCNGSETDPADPLEETPRWTGLKTFRIVDFYDNLSIFLSNIEYSSSAAISVAGLRKSNNDRGHEFDVNKSLFTKLVQRTGDRVNILKVEQRPTEDQHTLTGWVVEEDIDLLKVEEQMSRIAPRIKLEGPSTRENVVSCLLKTNLDAVEHASIGRRPLSKKVWKKLGCQKCRLKSLRVVGDDLNLIKILQETPPPVADPTDPATNALHPEYYFSCLDRLYLENWAMNAPMSLLADDPASVADDRRPMFTAEGNFSNFEDLEKVILARVKRGYGPKNLIITPIEGPFEDRIRDLMDYCEGAGLLNMPLLESSEEDSESNSE